MKLLEDLNEGIVISLSILNHHLTLEESNAKEFIELTEEAKQAKNTFLIDFEKGILVMVTGSWMN